MHSQYSAVTAQLLVIHNRQYTNEERVFVYILETMLTLEAIVTQTYGTVVL